MYINICTYACVSISVYTSLEIFQDGWVLCSSIFIIYEGRMAYKRLHIPPETKIIYIIEYTLSMKIVICIFGLLSIMQSMISNSIIYEMLYFTKKYLTCKNQDMRGMMSYI